MRDLTATDQQVIFSTRWQAYAAAHGRTCEAQLAHDRRFRTSPLDGYRDWIALSFYEWQQEWREADLDDPMRLQTFDEWLAESERHATPPLRGFGVTITPDGARNWYVGADGVRRWSSNDQPTDEAERLSAALRSAFLDGAFVVARQVAEEQRLREAMKGLGELVREQSRSRITPAPHA